MLAVAIGRLGHSNAQIVAALGARSGYVAGHGGGHISKWLGRVNRGMDSSQSGYYCLEFRLYSSPNLFLLLQ